MRTIRVVTASAALLGLLLPATTEAQLGRRFENAWFFGAKAGSGAIWTTTTRGYAPLIGGETLITRRRGGLYISYDQMYLGTFRDADFTTTVPDPIDGERLVELGEMRRVTAMAMLFPNKRLLWRPYFGVGFAVNMMLNSQPVGDYVSTSHEEFVRETIDESSTRAAPIIMGGMQMELLRFSVFGQASYMPAQTDFLLNGNETYFLEFGIRYNLGSSIERIR